MLSEFCINCLSVMNLQMDYLIYIIAFIILVFFLIVAYKRLSKKRYKEKELAYSPYDWNAIKIDPSAVPEHLRDLIPIAEKWCISDDLVRTKLEDKATE